MEMEEIIINQSIDFYSINNFTKASLKSSLVNRSTDWFFKNRWRFNVCNLKRNLLWIWMVQFKYLFHMALFSIYCLNVRWERSRRGAGAGGICNRALNGSRFALHWTLFHNSGICLRQFPETFLSLYVPYLIWN